MAERKSPLMAIIGKDGPQGFETADGLEIDLGGSSGGSLYIHHINFETSTHYGELEYISTKNTPITRFSEIKNDDFVFLPSNSMIMKKSGDTRFESLFNVIVDGEVLPKSILAYAIKPMAVGLSFSIECISLTVSSTIIRTDKVRKYI